MRILGIDPGSVTCGYGVIDVEGKTFHLVEYGVVHVKRHSSSFPQRLREIHRRLQAVIERSKPDVCAMEKVFYAKSVKSVVQLSHARGVAMLVCADADRDPIEYTPMQVKRAVTGRGAASKEQVQQMVLALLRIDETPDYYDATDALAIAICHAINGGPPQNVASGRTAKKTKNAWKKFIEENPGRVK